MQATRSFSLSCSRAVLAPIRRSIAMLYAVVGLIVLASIGLAVYALISKGEAAAQIAALQGEIQEQVEDYSAEIEALKVKMAAKVSAFQKELLEQGDRYARDKEGLRSDSAMFEQRKQREHLE